MPVGPVTSNPTMTQTRQGALIPASPMQYGSTTLLVGSQVPDTHSEDGPAGHLSQVGGTRPNKDQHLPNGASANLPVNTNSGATSKQRSEKGDPSKPYGAHGMHRNGPGGGHNQPRGTIPTGLMADHLNQPEFSSDQPLENQNPQDSGLVPKERATDSLNMPHNTQGPCAVAGPTEPSGADIDYLNSCQLENNSTIKKQVQLPTDQVVSHKTLLIKPWTESQSLVVKSHLAVVKAKAKVLLDQHINTSKTMHKLKSIATLNLNMLDALQPSPKPDLMEQCFDVMNPPMTSCSTSIKWQTQIGNSQLELEALMLSISKAFGGPQTVIGLSLRSLDMVHILSVFRWYQYQSLGWSTKNTQYLFNRVIECWCQSHSDLDGRTTGGGCTQNLPIGKVIENPQGTCIFPFLCWSHYNFNLSEHWEVLEVVSVISGDENEVYILLTAEMILANSNVGSISIRNVCWLTSLETCTWFPRKMIISYSYDWTPIGLIIIFCVALRTCNLLLWFALPEWVDLYMHYPLCEDSTWSVGTCTKRQACSLNPVCHPVLLRVPLGKSVASMAPVPPPLPGGSVSRQLSACSCFRSELAFSDWNFSHQFLSEELKSRWTHLRIMNVSTPTFPPPLTQNSLFSEDYNEENTSLAAFYKQHKF